MFISHQWNFKNYMTYMNFRNVKFSLPVSAVETVLCDFVVGRLQWSMMTRQCRNCWTEVRRVRSKKKRSLEWTSTCGRLKLPVIKWKKISMRYVDMYNFTLDVWFFLLNSVDKKKKNDWWIGHFIFLHYFRIMSRLACRIFLGCDFRSSTLHAI